MERVGDNLARAGTGRGSKQFVEFFIGSKLDVQGTLDANFPGVEPPHTRIEMGQGGIMQAVRVETGRRLDNPACRKKIFREVPMIRVVNSPRSRVELEVSEEIKRQYPEEWMHFCGTPDYKAYIQREERGESDYHPIRQLLEMDEVGPGSIRSLEEAGIRSIEALVEASQTQIDHIPRWSHLRSAAQMWVEEYSKKDENYTPPEIVEELVQL